MSALATVLVMSTIYNTVIVIPNREILSSRVDSYFKSDDYAREKLGNNLVDKLYGQELTLGKLLVMLDLVIKGDRSAQFLIETMENVLPDTNSVSNYALL